MAGVEISKQDLEKWADILIHHSLGGVGEEDRVMLKGEAVSWPLLEILERKIIELGAIPDLLIVPPNNPRGRVWSSQMAQLGSSKQHAQIPEWHRQRYESMTKYIEVLGTSQRSPFANLDAEAIRAHAEADRPFTDLRLSKRWALTLFPTIAGAESEGLDFEDYTEFVVRASTFNPQALKAAEERLAPLFAEGEEIEVVTHHPTQNRDLTLRLGIKESIPLLCYGLRNHPDGEVATSPNANEVEGELFLDLPVSHSGRDIQGIYLKLNRGRIVDYHAEVGHEHLQAIIETDDGSHRLGEVALGMNPGMDRVLKEPLFVEKVGGTLHVAIGASYETCYVPDPADSNYRRVLEEYASKGILNRSAQHVDIVADFRSGGCGRSVKIDGQVLVVRNNSWIPA